MNGWQRYKDIPIACPRTVCARGEEAEQRLQRGALGDGEGIQESQSQRQRPDSQAAARSRERIPVVARSPRGACPVLLWNDTGKKDGWHWTHLRAADFYWRRNWVPAS